MNKKKYDEMKSRQLSLARNVAHTHTGNEEHQHENEHEKRRKKKKKEKKIEMKVKKFHAKSIANNQSLLVQELCSIK